MIFWLNFLEKSPIQTILVNVRLTLIRSIKKLSLRKVKPPYVFSTLCMWKVSTNKIKNNAKINQYIYESTSKLKCDEIRSIQPLKSSNWIASINIRVWVFYFLCCISYLISGRQIIKQLNYPEKINMTINFLNPFLFLDLYF